MFKSLSELIQIATVGDLRILIPGAAFRRLITLDKKTFMIIRQEDKKSSVEA